MQPTVFAWLLSRYEAGGGDMNSAAAFVAYADAELRERPPVALRQDAGYPFLFRDQQTGACVTAPLFNIAAPPRDRLRSVAITPPQRENYAPQGREFVAIQITGDVNEYPPEEA